MSGDFALKLNIFLMMKILERVYDEEYALWLNLKIKPLPNMKKFGNDIVSRYVLEKA